jgi:hypothetical protein
VADAPADDERAGDRDSDEEETSHVIEGGLDAAEDARTLARWAW